MSSPINDFFVVTRDLPNYLSADQVGGLAEEVASRNLELLSTFLSKDCSRGRVLVKGDTRGLEIARDPSWSYSWPAEQKKEMLKVVAASFHILRKTRVERASLNFNVTELKEESALKGLRELASVIEQYWEDQEVFNDTLALIEDLQQESGNSPMVELNLNSLLEEERKVNVVRVAVVEQSPSQSPQEAAWWSCLHRMPLPSFRSISPCCCPLWCNRWIKPLESME